MTRDQEMDSYVDIESMYVSACEMVTAVRSSGCHKSGSLPIGHQWSVGST